MTSAVDREVEWLTAAGDGLPALQAVDGGPWQAVQAYKARTPRVGRAALYVRRTSLTSRPYATGRRLPTHTFRVEAWWPIGATTTAAQLWETEQRAFDDALDLVVARVTGGPDHSHGARFLSVAEDTAGIAIQFPDPEVTLHGPNACLRADITYAADDLMVTA